MKSFVAFKVLMLVAALVLSCEGKTYVAKDVAARYGISLTFSMYQP